MGAILKRELSSYFNSAIAYVVLAAYFFFSGVFFYNYCIVYNSASLSYVYGNMLLIILFIIPIMTMKSFADEKYQRTDQALFTAPVSLTKVVLGKFLGAFVLYAICSAIFLLYVGCNFISLQLRNGRLFSVHSSDFSSLVRLCLQLTFFYFITYGKHNCCRNRKHGG